MRKPDSKNLQTRFKTAQKTDQNILMAGDRTKVSFASLEKGRALITAEDDFLTRLSPFDRQCRLLQNEEVSQEAVIEHTGNQILEWTAEEKEKITKGVQYFKDLSADLHLPLPEEVVFVKTTGLEEGGGAYTRANAIYLPVGFMADPPLPLDWVVCHEFFHVLTRNNPKLREDLYQIIGFHKCGEVELPPELKDKKTSNPDAPINDHVIKLQIDGKDHWALPVNYSPAAFNKDDGKSYFDYMTFRLLLVEAGQKSSEEIRAAFTKGEAKLYKPNEVSGFFEQIGKNTTYIVHPEEILAENFVHMLTKTPNLDAPHITKKIYDTLKNNRAPAARPKPATRM